MKTCTNCRVEKPLTAFRPYKRSRDKLRYQCWDCEYQQERSRPNYHERARKRQQTYRATEKGQAAREAWTKTDGYTRYSQRRKEQAAALKGVRLDGPSTKVCSRCRETKPVEEYSFRYGKPIARCKSCIVEVVQEYTAKNRDASLQRMKGWYEANKRTEEFRTKRQKRYVSNDARRRARKLSAPGSGISRKDWESRLEWFGHACIYCGATDRKLTLDHVEPLARGGWDTPANAVPACMSCNASKNDRFLLEWVWAGGMRNNPLPSDEERGGNLPASS